jgi:hypothetical protein
MAFPKDLADVVVFKIHPAIGIARVADNDDYYVFGDRPDAYKSNGRMKRQAVQFRVFAYGENNVGLGELTADLIGALKMKCVWSARVANRKIAFQEHVPLSGTQHVVSASASSDDANAGKLIGSLPDFAEGAAIPLGQITETGLFIPPKGEVFRKTPGLPIDPYPATSTKVADTTGDGSVSVKITQGKKDLRCLPACIVVAPQDFSPDVDPIEDLAAFIRRKLQTPASPPSSNLNNQTARELDDSALRSCTNDFLPGFEVSFGGRGEVPDLRKVFYKPDDDPAIGPEELRVRYRANPGDPGAVLGQLTSGLCSTWQGDFTACVGYWTENLPETAFLDEDTSIEVRVFRKKYADQSPDARPLTTGDDFDRHVDEMGVVRRIKSKLVETERGPGDDVQN